MYNVYNGAPNHRMDDMLETMPNDEDGQVKFCFNRAYTYINKYLARVPLWAIDTFKSMKPEEDVLNLRRSLRYIK